MLLLEIHPLELAEKSRFKVLRKTTHRIFSSEVLHYLGLGLLQAADCFWVLQEPSAPEAACFAGQELDMEKPPALQELG